MLIAYLDIMNEPHDMDASVVFNLVITKFRC